MTVNLDSPFWKAMSFVMAGLVSGAIFIAVTSLNKLDKVSDAQIETKTMLTILLAQQDKNIALLYDNISNVNQLNIRMIRVETILQPQSMPK